MGRVAPLLPRVFVQVSEVMFVTCLLAHFLAPSKPLFTVAIGGIITIVVFCKLYIMLNYFWFEVLQYYWGKIFKNEFFNQLMVMVMKGLGQETRIRPQ